MKALKTVFVLLLLTLVACIVFLAHYHKLQRKPASPASQYNILPVTLSSSYDRKSNYIAVKEYSGQIGAGVRALISLQCWAASFSIPAYIVEPFIQRSTLMTNPKNIDFPQMIKFSDHFDMENFNKISLEEGMPSLVPWDEFIANSPKNVIVGDLEYYSKCRGRTVTIISERKFNDTPPQWLPKWLFHENRFSVQKLVRLQGCLATPSKASEMYEVLFQGLESDGVTVLFSKWKGFSKNNSIQNPNARPKLNCDEMITSIEKKNQHKFLPSLRLRNDAQYYIETFLKSRNRVAVMVRAEHTIRDNIKSFKDCLQKTVNLTRYLASSGPGGKDKIFLSLDVGKYGSQSFGSMQRKKTNVNITRLVQSVKDLVPELYDKRWTFSEWEETFSKATRGLKSPGYIASLQRIIASKSECLVLMGGGQFQRLTLIDYLENHPQPSQQCVRYVCVPNKQYESFLQEHVE